MTCPKTVADAAALGRIQIDTYVTSATLSTEHATKPKSEPGQKRSRQENSKDAAANDSKMGPSPVPVKPMLKDLGIPDVTMNSLLSRDATDRRDCRYKHMATIPEKARERITTWAARKGLVLRPSL